MDTRLLDGRSARLAVRSGAWTGPTASLAPGYAQANFVALPSRYAFDFLLFCVITSYSIHYTKLYER